MKKFIIFVFTAIILSVVSISCGNNDSYNDNIEKELSILTEKLDELTKINYDSLYRVAPIADWAYLEHYSVDIVEIKNKIDEIFSTYQVENTAFSSIIKNICDSLSNEISSIKNEQKEIIYKKELKNKYGNSVVKKLFSYVVWHDVRGNGSRVYNYFNPCDLSLENASDLCETIKVLSRNVPNFLTTQEDDINGLMFTDVNDRSDITFMRKKYSLYKVYGQARVERVLEWQDIDNTARLLGGNFYYGDSEFIKGVAKDRSEKWYEVLTKEERIKKDREERDAFIAMMAEDRMKYEQEQRDLKTFNKKYNTSVAYTPFGEVVIISKK